MVTSEQTSALASAALEFAVRSHAGQRRDGDGAPFIEHPLEVARLLREIGGSEVLVAAGLLHDVVEDTGVGLAELRERFGGDVADLVAAVTDDAGVEDYRGRKQALREQVRGAGPEVALLFAADKISKVRELHDQIRHSPIRPRPGTARALLESSQRLRLEHYRRSLAMLRDVAPRDPLVIRLGRELARCRRTIRGNAARRRWTR